MTKHVKYRHEFKYLCNETQLAIVKSRLQNMLAYDSHTQDGSYCVRSMYFDNYANRCYYENENGTSPREKFRIRIYNAQSNHISLECKRKEGDKTYKTACSLSDEEYYTILNGGSLDNLVDKNELLRKFTLLIKTQKFQPAIIVEYDRTPYIYSIGNVRVTLDRNIRSSNDFQHFFSKNLSTRQILPKGYHLVEVKYDELLPEFIKEILQIGDLQRSTFSKYYLCRKFSTGGLI